MESISIKNQTEQKGSLKMGDPMLESAKNALKIKGLHTISVKDIKVGVHLRKVDKDWARLLAEDIKRDGLRDALHVVEGDGAYHLIHGAHRLAATKILEEEDVLALVFEGSGPKVNDIIQLMAVSANFLSRPSTALQRSIDLNTARDSYERLYPASKRGGDRRSKTRENAEPFADYIAKRLDVGARRVFKIMALANNIAPDVRETILPTNLADQENILGELGSIDHEKQIGVVDQLLTNNSVSSTELFNQIKGINRIAGSADDKALNGLSNVWSLASNSVRRRFLAKHYEEIAPLLDDTPGKDQEVAG